MKRLLFWFACFVTLASPTAAHADSRLTVEVRNLTRGIHFTPFLVAAHGPDTAFFRTGEAASAELRAMAEGGDIADLSAMVSSAGGVVVENPAGGLLAPGQATSLEFDTDRERLSLVAMMLPTNDGFVGLNAWPVPSGEGTYTLLLNAYDAGTERNDEIVNGGGAPGIPGIPLAPGEDAGRGGSGVDTREVGVVHVHPGNLGDTDTAGGISDVDSRAHRWLNPVVSVTVRVQQLFTVGGSGR